VPHISKTELRGFKSFGNSSQKGGDCNTASSMISNAIGSVDSNGRSHFEDNHYITDGYRTAISTFWNKINISKKAFKIKKQDCQAYLNDNEATQRIFTSKLRPQAMAEWGQDSFGGFGKYNCPQNFTRFYAKIDEPRARYGRHGEVNPNGKRRKKCLGTIKEALRHW
jgi:hypothetical protein